MKRLLTILCIPAVLLLSSTEGWSLPPCRGSNFLNWSNCVGTDTFPDGSKYVGEWKDGDWHGQGTMTFFDGGKLVGGWKSGKPHGKGTMIYPDGRFRKVTFRNGELLESEGPPAQRPGFDMDAALPWFCAAAILGQPGQTTSGAAERAIRECNHLRR